MTQPNIDTRRAPDIRWQLFDALKSGREEWGLKDRTLAVLQALLTFLPKGERAHFVVFPSNRCLSERLMGMPESTLRRHLTRLVEVGLIARQTSPNGKRYRIARDLAYGFDLGPFFASGTCIRRKAEAMAQVRQRLRELRARVRDAMTRLADDATLTRLNRVLRRKLSEAELRGLLQEIQPGQPLEKAVSAAQNDRHLDTSTEDNKTTAEVVSALETLSGQPIRSQSDLTRAGERLAKSSGTLPGWSFAVKTHGPVWASLSLVYLWSRLPDINQPNRYLIALCRKAQSRDFDLLPSLRRLASGPDWIGALS